MNRIFPINLSKEVKDLELWGWNLCNISIEEISYVKKNLELEEIEKGQRYIHIKNQFHFYISRFIAKKILGRYINQFPNQVKFHYLENGKPFIISSPALNFNISHSRNLGIIGISFATQIGVDIEYVKVEQEILNAAELFLNEAEKKWVMEEDCYNRIYKLWTVKEAFLKYAGTGIKIEKFPVLNLDSNRFLDNDAKFISIKLDNYWCSICFNL